MPKAAKLLATVCRFGNHLPTPAPHAGMPGHYQTLLQVLGPLGKGAVLDVDEGLPSVPAKGAALCKRGCRMMCLSKAGEQWHDVLFHFDRRQAELRQKRKHRQREQRSEDESGEGQPAGKKVWRCGYQECDFTCTTQYQLRAHKKKESHKKARGRPHK